MRKKKQEILEKHIETQKVRCRRNKGFCCSVLICIDLDDLSKIIMGFFFNIYFHLKCNYSNMETSANVKLVFLCLCLLQLLISKLEKNKSMKAEDKAKIMETLDMLTKSITKLQEEIKLISSNSNPLRIAKSKAQVVLPKRRNTPIWSNKSQLIRTWWIIINVLILISVIEFFLSFFF